MPRAAINTTQVQEDVINALRKAREHRGVSYRRLAAECGLHLQTVHRLLGPSFPDVAPTLQTIVALAWVLDVPLWPIVDKGKRWQPAAANKES